MVRLVLFDIDGTLIRTGGAGVKAFERTFATEFNLPGAVEGINFSGRTDPSIVREAFLRRGITPTEQHFQVFYDRYVFWLDELLHQLDGAPCPGVETFIDDLHHLPKPPVLGLLTGNIRLGAEIKLRHYNLWRHFHTGGFGDDHEDRNTLAAIAKKRGGELIGARLSDDEVLVIGDTARDIECGQAINARVLAVGTGLYSPDQLSVHKPTWAVADLCAISAAEVCR
ncbi:MAG TPA: HAD hydrolase-like protein [Methylomirabilota bacterium]|nr:HAD hydrolase-like protein [Methylomirabilota bacterium]